MSQSLVSSGIYQPSHSFASHPSQCILRLIKMCHFIPVILFLVFNAALNDVKVVLDVTLDTEHVSLYFLTQNVLFSH